MKTMLLTFFVYFVALCCVGSISMAQTNTVSLTYNSSTTQYAAIGAAYAALTSVSAGPALIELSSGYTGASETFPITLGPVAGASATNTITIRPAAGATVLSFSTINANYFKVNGGTYITIDGRAGGTGTSENWTIQVRASGTSSTAVYFLGDAQHNTLEYCAIQSEILSQTAGVVRFGSGITVGVNDIKVLNCDISDYFDGTTHFPPRTVIFSVGASASLLNSNIEIGNCNIFNYASSSSAFAIYLTNNNTNWNIHGNSFFMTVATSLSANNYWGALSINGTTDGVTFSNNFIGGTSSQCGGSVMSLGGDAQLGPIKFSVVGTTNKNTVTNNSIKNITFTRANASASTSGMIILTQGDFNDVTGNVISNITGNFSLATHGLRGMDLTTATPNPMNASKNAIGDLVVTGQGFVDGIYVSGGNAAVSNNMINLGSGTSIDAVIKGIILANGANTANVYFNTVNIGGSISTGSANTLAIYRTSSGPVLAKNNIAVNTRSGGTGNHAAIQSSGSNLMSDYNNLYASPSLPCSVDGSTFTDLATWMTNTSQDANSKTFAPSFVSTADVHLSLGSVNHNYDGTPIAGITTDIDGDTRDLSIPYIGADEVGTYPLPV